MELSERKASLDALRDEITELSDATEPTEEQVSRLEAAIEEYEAGSAEYTRLMERAEKIEKIRNAEIREPAVASPEVFVRDTQRDVFDRAETRELVYRAKVLDDDAARDEVIGRAKQVVEETRGPASYTDTEREAATQLLERTENPEIADHILRTGSPEYHKAFKAYMRGDFTQATQAFPEESRAAFSLTNANGGFLVPFTLDPTIILTSAGSSNPFRQISRVESITTDDWNGVSSAGVTAEWLAEATEAADATPTVAQPSITVYKAAAYLQASIEVTQDSNVASQIGMLIADAKANLEATAFATGSGSSQPVGIVTALGLTTTSRVAGSSGAAGAADLVAADIFALDNNLGDRYRSNASFVANKTTWNSVRRLANVNAGNNPASFWVDFGGGLPASLIGYPVYESSAMDSTIVSGSNDDVIILGDFRNYVIVDRVGLAVAYNPLVVSTGSGRPTGEVGWFAYWRVGGDSVNDAAFRMLRL